MRHTGIIMGLRPRSLSTGEVSAGDAPQDGIVIPGDGGIPGDDPGDPAPQAGQFRYYCGDVVYDMGTTRLLTDEGYVTFSSDGTPQYHYYLRDHLGNVRVVFDQTGTVEQVNHYYAFGGLMRESTNPGVQPYKYGGKELDRTGGLDAYDFGARSYFADRLQWSTMDPLCEKYYDVTPYGYCHNDPVNKKDINGMDDLFDMNGFYICDTGAGRNVVIVNGNDFSLLYSFNYDNQYNKNMLIYVASYYLKQSDSGDFSVSINSGSDNEVDATLGYHILEDSYLVCVDNGKLNPALDDKYNFQSIADHESIHRYDKSMHNESIGEVLTIIKQAKAPSWEKTSIDYKYSQAQYAMNCLNKDLHNLDFQTAVNYVDKLNEAFGNVNTFMLLPGRVSSVNNLNENVVRGHKR